MAAMGSRKMSMEERVLVDHGIGSRDRAMRSSRGAALTPCPAMQHGQGMEPDQARGGGRAAATRGGSGWTGEAGADSHTSRTRSGQTGVLRAGVDATAMASSHWQVEHDLES